MSCPACPHRRSGKQIARRQPAPPASALPGRGGATSSGITGGGPGGPDLPLLPPGPGAPVSPEGTAGAVTRPRRPGFLLAALPGPLRLLLLTQLAFNIGFYLVVPFLAAHLSGNLHLAGWIIGAVLGLRTFSQQGMFFLGGALADRFGIKATIVIGCLIRIAGFTTLGLTSSLPGIIAGVVLVGFAAALFSPATESAIVAWGKEVEYGDGPSLPEIVGLESMFSKLGSVLGPVLGAVLMVVPFTTTCLVAAAIFAVILAAQLIWLPARSRAGEPAGVCDSLGVVLRDRPFLIFAVIHSAYLVGYNQLYLGLPVELDRIGAPQAAITWFFALAAVLTITCQLAVTRIGLSWGTATSLRRGYLLISAAMLAVAAATPFAPASGYLAYLPAAGFVVLLHLGQMLVLPTARNVVAHLSGGYRLGTYLGVLASAGGLAVLAGSTVAGQLLDLAHAPGPLAAVPWLFLAALPAASAAAITTFLRRHPVAVRPPGTTPGSDGSTKKAKVNHEPTNRCHHASRVRPDAGRTVAGFVHGVRSGRHRRKR